MMFDKKLIKIKKNDILILLLILSITVFFSVWNLKNWWLIDSDEINMISFLKKPLLSIGSPTSTYFPTLIIAKLFFFIDSFPEYRYITAFSTILGIFFIFLTTKTFLLDKKYFAILPPLLIITNGFILYATHRFTVDALNIAIIGLILYLVFLWRKFKNNIFIPLIFILSALGINNHGIILYFVTPLLLWFIYLFLKRKINFKIISFSGILFLFIIIPYINAIKNTNYSSYILEKYYGMDIKAPHLINLIYPNFFITSSFQLFTISYLWEIMSSIPLPWFVTHLSLLSFFIILIIPLLVYFYRKTFDKDLKFLILYSYSIIIVMLFSPIPSSVGHFIPFFIVFSCLLAKELSLKKASAKLVLIPIILIIFFNLLFTYQIITKNSYEDLKNLWPKNSKKITIELIVYRMLNFAYPQILNDINDFNVFECRLDGIYAYNNSNIIHNPNFFKEQKFVESDLVILHAASTCDFYNIFSVNDLPLKYIGRVNEIAFFNKT